MPKKIRATRVTISCAVFRIRRRLHVGTLTALGLLAVALVVAVAPADGSLGVLDPSFGAATGLVTTSIGTSAGADAVVLQPDGEIVAAGAVVQTDSSQDFALVRYQPGGSLDTTFGTGGVANPKVLKSVTESYAVSLQGDNYILAGYGNDTSTEKVDMVVYRFTAAGALDPTFGTAGVARLDLAKEDDRARNVMALPDGRIIATGSGKLTAANVDAMVALFDKNGAPAADFGKGGYVLSDLGGPADAWYGVTLSADRKFVYIAGYKGTDTAGGGNDDAVLTRLAI